MLTDSPNSPAQHLLITLLADYQHVAQSVPSGLLVEVLGELGVSSDAVRTALSRLVRTGLVERSKRGRSTSYGLSLSGVQDVSDSTERILSFGKQSEWDGQWTLVAFSVTEKYDRQLRNQLRSRLRVHGFTPIYDGLWGSTRSAIDDVRDLLSDLKISDVTYFRGRLELSEPVRARLRASHDVEAVRADYEQFIRMFSPLKARVERDDVSPSESLIARTKLLDAWRTFPGRDPDLSEEYFGSIWPRAEARNIFITCFQGLGPTAELRLRMLLKSYSVSE